MAQPDHDNFRQKLIQAIELETLLESETSQLFNISRKSGVAESRYKRPLSLLEKELELLSPLSKATVYTQVGRPLPKPLSCKEMGFESCSPSLQWKGLGVRSTREV